VVVVVGLVFGVAFGVLDLLVSRGLTTSNRHTAKGQRRQNTRARGPPSAWKKRRPPKKQTASPPGTNKTNKTNKPNKPNKKQT
jgi:hypothetical protein